MRTLAIAEPTGAFQQLLVVSADHKRCLVLGTRALLACANEAKYHQHKKASPDTLKPLLRGAGLLAIRRSVLTQGLTQQGVLHIRCQCSCDLDFF